jgi:hypothetical protein
MLIFHDAPKSLLIKFKDALFLPHLYLIIRYRSAGPGASRETAVAQRAGLQGFTGEGFRFRANDTLFLSANPAFICKLSWFVKNNPLLFLFPFPTCTLKDLLKATATHLPQIKYFENDGSHAGPANIQ